MSRMALPPLGLIAAMDRQGVIGERGHVPWHHPEDLRHFRRHTLGHAVLMGRATYESLGRPLPRRTNIVLTSQTAFRAEGCLVASSLHEALVQARQRDPAPFIIGGAKIYAEAMPLVTRMLLTLVPGTHPDGDTWFPAYPKEDFTVVEQREEAGLTFLTLDRIR